MRKRLHPRASTTPETRRYIQLSDKSVAELACELGIGETTVRKWKSRTEVHDRSFTAHNLQTVFSPLEEALAVELRKTLLLPLNDLLIVFRKFVNPKHSRSALNRCLVRHNASNLRYLIPQDEKEPPVNNMTLKNYKPGYLHLQIKSIRHILDEGAVLYLFLAVDRATRWIYLETLTDKKAVTAAAFIERLIENCPLKIRKVLTDNGKEFTDRFFGRPGRYESASNHPFDRVCRKHGIEHRLTEPDKEAGIIERFNKHILEIYKITHSRSPSEIDKKLQNYLETYINFIPQKSLKNRTPLEALHHYYQTNREYFHKHPPEIPVSLTT